MLVSYAASHGTAPLIVILLTQKPARHACLQRRTWYYSSRFCWPIQLRSLHTNSTHLVVQCTGTCYNHPHRAYGNRRNCRDCVSAMLFFGALLKQLRKRAGMTQRDLAAALNYSDSFISSLEHAQRQPDLDAVIARFIPALGLQDDPTTAAHLIELAATARGERPPDPATLRHLTHRATSAAPDAHPGGLPTPPDALIGRDDAVNRLCNRLRGHSGRLVTLVGPPGIGKTRLALAVAARLQRHYPDGVVFVPLAATTEPSVMAATIVARVGNVGAQAKPPHVQVIAALRGKRLLLVLDNCEQIAGTAPLIADMLAACPGLTILATSRERLHLRAEQRYHVAPLELEAAVELFAQRAAAIDADFAVSAANRPTIEAICQRLDRLPLALELCAAQIDLLGPAQILAHLHARPLDLLVDGAHDLPPHHRTLRTAIQRSYALLTADERVLFRRLGVFVGGGDLEALTAVTWQAAPDPRTLLAPLHGLIGKSLVRAATAPTGARRFLMLETIRAYAQEHLHACGEQPAVRDRHSDYFLALAERARAAMYTVHANVWLEQLATEHDNLRATMATLDAHGQPRKLARLCASMAWFWWYRSHYAEAQQCSERALSQCAQLPPALHARLLLECAWFPPRIAQRIQYLETSLELYRALGDQHGTAWVLVRLSLMHHRNGDYAAARGPVALCMPLARALHDPALLAAALTQAGELAIADRNQDRAQPILKEALTRYRDLGSEQHISGVLFLLGQAAEQRGAYRHAETLFAESAALRRTMGDHRGAAAQLSNVGTMALRQGDVARAARLQCESLRIYGEIGWEQGIGWTLLLLAEIANARDRHARVARLLGAEEQIRTGIGYQIWPELHVMYARLIAATRAALGAAGFAGEWAVGRTLTMQQAVAFALEE